MDDEESLELAEEMYNNLGNQVVCSRYGTALDKRYGKPLGTSEFQIREEGMTPKLLIESLKADTKLYL